MNLLVMLWARVPVCLCSLYTCLWPNAGLYRIIHVKLAIPNGISKGPSRLFEEWLPGWVRVVLLRAINTEHQMCWQSMTLYSSLALHCLVVRVLFSFSTKSTLHLCHAEYHSLFPPSGHLHYMASTLGSWVAMNGCMNMKWTKESNWD